MKTERLRITPFKQEDLQGFLEFYNQRETMNYVASGKSEWSSDELSEKIKSLSGDEPFGVYTVVLKSKNKVVGEISVFDSFSCREKVEIGYILNSDYHRRGLAYEMLCEFIDYLKSECDVKVIVARVNSENISSIALCNKLKFKLIAVDNIDEKVRYTYEL